MHAQEAAEVEKTVLAVPEEEALEQPEIDEDTNPRLLKERNPITDKLAQFFKK